ncbi:MAG: putative glycosyltransferase [Geminicoccaceae bacterium]|nr:putative glycosyltransferase [Geminicoccaceae bacterium]
MTESAERVAVIILTYNQREVTLRCLASLQQAGEPSFQVLVWDNGSSDGTAEALRRAYPEVLVHEHSCNLGVGSGRNAAAALARRRFAPTHLLFLDNDIVVAPGFVRELLIPFREDPMVAQVQSKLRLLNEPARLNDGGGCRIEWWWGRTSPVGFGELDEGQHDRIVPCVACGGSMMVRADRFDQLGGFDPIFDPFGPEDLDFSLRLQRAGYKALYVPGAMGYHEVSHTFGKGYTQEYARTKSRHWLRLMRRHASVSDWAGFLLLGAPTALVRMTLREARRGNLRALLGTLRGVLDISRSRAAS